MQLTRLGFEAVGSDLTDHPIKKAQNIYPETHYVVDDFLNSKFEDNEFDFILDKGVFMYLNETRFQHTLTR